jgi:hypothetical protein
MRRQYHLFPGARGLDAWDVHRLVELSRDLPVEQVEVASLADVDTPYWFHSGQPASVRAVVEHARLIHEVDVSYPIILGPDGRILDGMHRVARALLAGRATIRAVRLEVLPPPDHEDCDPADLPYD